jgi:hypothetical protein
MSRWEKRSYIIQPPSAREESRHEKAWSQKAR